MQQWTREKYLIYLKSAHWQRVKKRYYKRHVYQCCVSGCPKRKYLQLHHLSYLRIGKERDTDLVYLCPLHHKCLHKGYFHISKIIRIYPRKKCLVKTVKKALLTLF